MDYEIQYLINHQHLDQQEAKTLVENRKRIAALIETGGNDEIELLLHMKSELELLMSCKLELQDNLNKDLVDLETLDTQILVILCDHIISLYDYILKIFAVREDLLSGFITIFIQNVVYVSTKKLEVLKEAVSNIGSDIQLWIKLQFLYVNLGFDNLCNVFQEGVDILKNDSMPLWLFMIKYMKFRCPEKLEQFYLENLNVPYENIAWEIRSHYLKWHASQHDINAARILYKELEALKPPSFKFYKSMIKIEIDNEEYLDIEFIRNIFKDGIRVLGETDISIWISYIRFEFLLVSPQSAKKVYTSSLCCLKSDLTDAMSLEYDKLIKNLTETVSDEVIVIN